MGVWGCLQFSDQGGSAVAALMGNDTEVRVPPLSTRGVEQSCEQTEQQRESTREPDALCVVEAALQRKQRGSGPNMRL